MNDHAEGEHIKETFAYFGRAIYLSSVLETGMAMMLLYLEFFEKLKKEMVAGSSIPFDRKKYELDFDAFMTSQHTLTMGNLIKGLSVFQTLSQH